MTVSIAERIETGVAILDQAVEDWPAMIDVDRIEIYSTSDCILGQVFDGYAAGKASLNLSSSEAWASGFCTPFMAEVPFLNEEWKSKVRELKTRQLQPA